MGNLDAIKGSSYIIFHNNRVDNLKINLIDTLNIFHNARDW